MFVGFIYSQYTVSLFFSTLGYQIIKCIKYLYDVKPFLFVFVFKFGVRDLFICLFLLKKKKNSKSKADLLKRIIRRSKHRIATVLKWQNLNRYIFVSLVLVVCVLNCACVVTKWIYASVSGKTSEKTDFSVPLTKENLCAFIYLFFVFFFVVSLFFCCICRLFVRSFTSFARSFVRLAVRSRWKNEK